ncbi:S-adenosyl-L-methionine-dependent methyltransferase [Lineolata rhizophorae]|uniref:S-adenosyl-L-methionine-dependent methyltransferase n=1 Tax=Lineolata rhizophorae TaxID=578093 RepID=A0A6A6NQ32_9PEZI|nr:S-adenosyl-L-methionine-dependent methyltransferase [Lineolata rhizophorae]
MTSAAVDPEHAATHNVEVDTAAIGSDSDSAYDEGELKSYTTSLASSVLNFPVEHGRRYHKFREGSYNFPNDEKEQDRLDFMSYITRLMTDGKLHQTPFPKSAPPKRILDVGTGTGIWAIDAAEEYPDAEVTGNDLSPIQPKWVPPNVQFEVDDVESEWAPRAAPYDFVFARYLAGSIKDWPRLVGQIHRNTRPGGWVEFQDYAAPYSQGGAARPDSPFFRMYDLLTQVIGKMGREMWPGPKLEGWVKDAGFTNVTHKVFKLPIGAWPKDPTLKYVGGLNLVQFLEGCEAYIIGPFTRGLGWTMDECQVLLAQVRDDVKKKNVYYLADYHVVYAQRPPE